MNSKTKRVAFLGLMTAFALVLSYVEMLLPPIYAALPAVKVGLPNIAIVFLLYKFSFKEAITVSVIRVLIVALLFGNVMTLSYSFAGAILSILVMAILKRCRVFTNVGVSVVGAVFHNLGQIGVAILLLDTVEIGYYMIVLAITGTLSGIAVGLLSALLLRHINNKKLKF